MSQASLKRLRFASVSIFLLGAITAVVAYSINHGRSPKPPSGFTIISRQTFTPADTRKPVLKADIERYQKADGAWVLKHTYYRPDGSFAKADKGFGQLGRGVFRVDENSQALSFLSPMAASMPAFSADVFEENMRKNPRFSRDETVHGFKALVLSSSSEDGAYDEDYYAPALQGMAIKHVWVTRVGVEVIEPVSITLGEPTQTAFETPHYPVEYRHFEKKIEASEKSGKRETARQMREQLERQKTAMQ